LRLNAMAIAVLELCAMGVRNPLGTQAGRLTVAVVVALGIGASVSGAPPAGGLAWHEKYKRPSEIPYPKDNPYSDAKFKLGRTLFFDPILSGSKSRSCESCHNPGLSWGDGQPRAIGEDQKPLPARAPTLLNVAWTPKLGWDGHFRDLEAVGIAAITSPGNMNLSDKALPERLSAIPAYLDAFDAAFGEGDITVDKVKMALATFERSIVSAEAPFDRWLNGDDSAIEAAAKRGFELFNGKANCAACHTGWAFTDSSFHDIGTAHGDDIGRGSLFPSSTALKYAFKTPTLRDVAHRAPYMHNGSVPTLEAVIDLYDRGGIERPSRDVEIHPLGLSDSEKADLIAFLRTLTGAFKPVALPELPR
jgi:cytochrome c peroxidase